MRDDLAPYHVRIFSREHGFYWRENGRGYTGRRDEAGIYSFEDAFKRTGHCGPEKMISYEVAEPEYFI